MDAGEVVKILRENAARFATDTELANEIGISTAYLSDVFHGKRYPGPAILNYLGLQKRVIYEYSPVDADETFDKPPGR